jgi:putative membrane protein
LDSAAREAPAGAYRGFVMPSEPITSESASDKINTELSSRRTGMSFQRTRMSADRTLMSVVRTSLSLIGFGFTIYQVFQKLHDSKAIGSDASARHFGLALVFLGVLMLVLGIIYQLRFMVELRAQRVAMASQGLIHAESNFPPSMTLATAIILLGIGIAAIASMIFNVTLF